jgi:Fe-S-cluster-containing dehydrogenase component
MCLKEADLDKELPPCVETCPTKALNLGKMEAKEKIRMEQEIERLVAT